MRGFVIPLGLLPACSNAFARIGHPLVLASRAAASLRLVTMVFDVRLGSILAVLKGGQMMPMR
jgi:hypothetical protein